MSQDLSYNKPDSFLVGEQSCSQNSTWTHYKTLLLIYLISYSLVYHARDSLTRMLLSIVAIVNNVDPYIVFPLTSLLLMHNEKLCKLDK